jgi:pentatricopeptide repeat protein
LACLSNSQDNRASAAARAEEVLRTMRDNYARGDVAVRPNSYCYNSVMDCWARASMAEKAEAVFLTMCEDYRNGNESAKPQTTTFNSKCDIS